MTLDDLISHYGSISEIARTLHISRAAVHQWRKYKVPLDRQIELEGLTKGAVRADVPDWLRKTDCESCENTNA